MVELLGIGSTSARKYDKRALRNNRKLNPKLIGLIFLWLSCFTLNASAAEPIVFFIAPEGNDRNSGLAEDAPFKTFERTLNAVASLSKPWPSDIVINVMPGDYFLSTAIALTEKHSGDGENALVFRNAGLIASPVLIGGQRLDQTKWKFLRDNIFYQNLPGVERINIIYENRRKARKARLPNYRYLDSFPTTDGEYFISGKVGKNEPYITAREADLSKDDLGKLSYDLEDGVENYLVVWGCGRADWHKWTYPIKRITPSSGKIFVDQERPAFHKGNQNEGNRYYIEGGLRLLDAKGEFYFDTKARRLYYKPHGDLIQAEVIYATMRNMVTVHNGKNIVFDGIQFACSGVLPYTDSSYTWSDTDAAIAVEDSEFIEILNCHFKSIGQTAVNFLRTHDSRVENCLMQYLGQSGIKIYHSDRNIIHNCLIHDIGLRRVYCEGVSVHASAENRISHLEIYNSARYGVTVRGKVNEAGHDRHPTRNNLFEYIKISDVNQDSGDTAGVHMARINAEQGANYVNTFNQITITRSVAQPHITDEWAPTGVYLDWMKMVMNQSMSNIEVEKYDPRYEGYRAKRFNGRYGDTDRISDRQRQIMQNRPWNNETSTKFNCSWQDDFEPGYIEYEKIGLTKAFPSEYLKRVRSQP